MGGGEVLEFVDEQAATPGLRRRAGTGIGHQDLDGPVDLLVEVDRPEVRQGGTVTIESLGDARRIGHRLLDGLRRVEPEPDGGQGADIGGDRVGVRLAPNVEQSLQEIAHGELLEHSRTTRRSELGADPQAGAVEGSDVRPFGREYPGAPLLHLIGRPGVVGQGTHGARRGSTVGDEMTQPFGQHPRLAGAGRGDHPGRPGVVAHSGQLVRCKLGCGGTVGSRCQPSFLGTPAVDDTRSGCEGRWIGRSAIDIERRAIGEDDVGRSLLGDAESRESTCGLPAVPPDRLTAPGVVGIGPHQELEPLHCELERGRQAVDGTVVPLGSPQCVQVRRQLDHQRPSIEPRLVERSDHRNGVCQLGIADPHPLARHPRVG